MASERDDLVLWASMAHNAVDLLTLMFLLKCGMVEPDELRDRLEDVISQFERDGTPPAKYASIQLATLLGVLESSSPQMIVTKWRRERGGPDA